MSEVLTAALWIFKTLSEATALTAIVSDRIYEGVVLAKVTFPLVLFQPLEATDFAAIGAQRIWSEMLWLVRGVDCTGTLSGDLDSIAERIDALLHREQSDTVAASVRIRPYTLLESIDEVQYRHLGGTYRIYGL